MTRSSYVSRRSVLKATAGSLLLAGVSGSAKATNSVDYEVWALDQKQNVAHVLEPRGDGELEEVDRIENLASTPHMISFTKDGDYGFIASTGGATTTMVDTDDREIVDTKETGAGSHFAGVQPNSDRIHVDVIGEEKIVELEYDGNGMEETRTLEINLTRRKGLGFDSDSPICHDYRPDGRFAYITFGPGFDEAGLAVLNTQSLELTKVYDPDEVQTNCGAIHHPTDQKIYLNGGDDDGESPWYVVDTRNQKVIVEDDTEYIDSDGKDAHGLWFTPDEEQLWMFNRQSNDGVIIDPDDDTIVDTVSMIGPDSGDKPDISGAPSGEDHQYMYVTLRGSDPEPAPVPGENPGVQVLDTDAEERVDTSDDEMENGVWQPRPFLGSDNHDFHGLGVRDL